jgi:hypothetical protein
MKCESCEKELINEHPYRTVPKLKEEIKIKLPIKLNKKYIGIGLFAAIIIISSILSQTVLRFNTGLVAAISIIIFLTYGLVRLGFYCDNLDSDKDTFKTVCILKDKNSEYHDFIAECWGKGLFVIFGIIVMLIAGYFITIYLYALGNFIINLIH